MKAFDSGLNVCFHTRHVINIDESFPNSGSRRIYTGNVFTFASQPGSVRSD